MTVKAPTLMILIALLAAPGMAAPACPPWDVSQPRGKVREIDFTTREGTWMSLDLSRMASGSSSTSWATSTVCRRPEGRPFLGAERDLGSLAVGKLADLLVLEKNPLDDIRNTASLRWVMKGGRLWEADTLDEVWPEAKPFGRFPWSL